MSYPMLDDGANEDASQRYASAAYSRPGCVTVRLRGMHNSTTALSRSMTVPSHLRDHTPMFFALIDAMRLTADGMRGSRDPMATTIEMCGRFFAVAVTVTVLQI